MEVLGILIGRMKDRFRPHISAGRPPSTPSLISLISSPLLVLPALRERLGDAKEQVREQAQQLTQKVMVDVVSSPQHFLDKLATPTSYSDTQ